MTKQSTGAGKGSKPRPFSNYSQFGKNWNDIDWGHKKVDSKRNKKETK